MITIESLLAVADVINRAYMKLMFNDTQVVSGINFYPFTPNLENQIQRGVSAVGVFIYPLCMCMGLPVFIYAIVMEKETRLLEIMKINGMKMSNYWSVNFLFNLIFYLITSFVFLVFGAKVFKLQMFVDTNLPLLCFTLLGWGLSQISLAFLMSVFINKAQNA